MESRSRHEDANNRSFTFSRPMRRYIISVDDKGNGLAHMWKENKDILLLPLFSVISNFICYLVPVDFMWGSVLFTFISVLITGFRSRASIMNFNSLTTVY